MAKLEGEFALVEATGELCLFLQAFRSPYRGLLIFGDRFAAFASIGKC